MSHTRNVFILLCSFAMLSATVLPVHGETTIDIQRTDALILQASLQTGDIDMQALTNSRGDFVRLVLPGQQRALASGLPELPQVHRLIEIPQGAMPRVEIISQDYVTVSLADLGLDIPVYPAQPSLAKNADPLTIPFVWDESEYQRNEFLPVETAVVEVAGTLRSVRIANLILRPISYNPVTNELQIITDIQVNIHLDNADLDATAELKAQYYSPVFEPIYEMLSYFDRPQERDDLVNYPVTYAIVANSIFDGHLDEYIDWQTQKGYHVEVGYTGDIGTTTNAIKNYLEDLYDNPVVSPPSFILIVGDVAQVPAWNGNTGGHVTDLKYAEYTNDYMPEVYFGRFSASNLTQLQAMVDKTLEYDQYAMPDPTYLNEVVMIAGMDSYHGNTWGNGQINYGTTYYFNEDHGLESHTYLYPASGSNSGNIVNNVSDGVSYINYTAHGNQTSWSDPSFTIANINSLQNYSEYCLAVGNCCLTNAFDTGTCFGEAWLRAEGKGAIGYIGGSNSTYWDEDYWWGVGSGSVVTYPTYAATGPGAYDGLFHDNGEDESEWYITNYAIIMAGNLAVVQGGGSANYYWEIYHLMGDPSLSTYMGVPVQNSVAHLPILQMGLDSFTINAEPYSYAGLSMDGVLYGAGQVDATGVLELQLDPIMTPGTASVVVTKQNRQPYIGSVEVGNAEGAYVIVDLCEVVMDSNGNFEVDYGEMIDMLIWAENVGQETATNVMATVTSSDPYITIYADTVPFGDIESGGIASSQGTISFDVSNETPDGHTANFDVHFTSEDQSWDHYFSVTINAYCVAGDINADWFINVLDVIRIVNFILNTDIPDELEFCSADIDENGIINILDVIQVINFIVGQDYGCRACRTEPAIDQATFRIHENTLYVSAPCSLAGLELAIQGTGLQINSDLDLDVMWHEEGSTTRILMYSAAGQALDAGEYELFSADADWAIEEAIVADLYGDALNWSVITVPSFFELGQNQPNPFNPTTDIQFGLTHGEQVQLVVLDLLGREVAVLANGNYSAGYHTVTWSGTDLSSQPVASGVYLYVLTVGEEQLHRKMLFLK